MKFSVPYYCGNPYLKSAEIAIRYTAKDQPYLIEFLDKHVGQRIVLRIFEVSALKEENYKFLSLLCSQYNQLVISFNKAEALPIDLPHFYNVPCYTLEQFQTFLNLGASDILVGGDLCYQLPYLKENYKCNLRVMPNLIQQAAEPMKAFFIRPEDLKIYSPYIDYVEFYYKDIRSIAKSYKAYAIDEFYDGWLEDIVIGAPPNIHNGCITSIMAIERLNCQKACCTQNLKCNICDSCFELAKTIYKKEIELLKK